MEEQEKTTWLKLYTLAKEIQKLEPWKIFLELDVFLVSIPTYKEPFYCTFHGNESPQKAIMVYPGILAIDGLWRFVKSEQMPPFQRMRYQQHLACFFVDSKEVSDEDKQRINQLGLKFRGKNWITFESALLNLVPSACTLSEAEILVEIYQQLIFAINDLMSDKVQVNFELGQVLHRQFDPFTNTWHSVVEPLEWSVDQVPMPTIYPEIIDEINQLPMTNDQFEIDIIHTPIIADEKEGQRQGIVRFALLADHKSGYVYKHELVHLEHNAQDVLLTVIIEGILQMNRPKQIWVRDDLSEAVLKTISEKTGIKIKVSQKLKSVDAFADKLFLHIQK
jgi:hypothetical protein